jgi:very-short-patch-repair endonuclease
VLYDLGTTAVVLAIELDDRSHDRDSRHARDQFVDEVLELCGVALLRVRAARGYDGRELEARMQGVLRGRSTPGRRHEREGK